MAENELTQLGECLIVAYFIVKGFLSWLADVAIWALRLLDPSHKDEEEDEQQSRKPRDDQLCERCTKIVRKIVEEALETERKNATKPTEQN